MKPFLLRFFLLFLLTNSLGVTDVFSQNVTGIWRGYFSDAFGQQYRVEFQVKESKGAVSVTGISYSWQDDIHFYGKATMIGTFIKTAKSFRIKEIRTIEITSPGGGACIMNYDLSYSKSGKEEFLDGTYLGKTEDKVHPNLHTWGDCGGGKVFLRKVPTSDFYVEPFLRNTPQLKPSTPKAIPVPNRPKPTTTPSVVKTDKNNKPVIPKPKNNNLPVKPPVTTTRPLIDSAQKVTLPVKPPVALRTYTPAPEILRTRTNELMKSLVVNNPDVTVKLYDNGEIDGDSISVYYDNKLVLSNKGLGTAPLTIKLKMEDDDEVHELVMVAINLGRIPPNTSLMIVEAGDQRFEVRITSTEQKNAVVKFRYVKPN